MAKQGDWVRIHQVILSPGERAPQVPEDTARVPLELWAKGWLQQDAVPGDTVRVRTRTGRELTGTLLEDATGYTHTFGEPLPELMRAADELKRRLLGDSHEG